MTESSSQPEGSSHPTISGDSTNWYTTTNSTSSTTTISPSTASLSHESVPAGSENSSYSYSTSSTAYSSVINAVPSSASSMPPVPSTGNVSTATTTPINSSSLGTSYTNPNYTYSTSSPSTDDSSSPNGPLMFYTTSYTTTFVPKIGFPNAQATTTPHSTCGTYLADEGYYIFTDNISVSTIMPTQSRRPPNSAETPTTSTLAVDPIISGRTSATTESSSRSTDATAVSSSSPTDPGYPTGLPATSAQTTPTRAPSSSIPSKRRAKLVARSSGSTSDTTQPLSHPGHTDMSAPCGDDEEIRIYASVLDEVPQFGAIISMPDSSSTESEVPEPSSTSRSPPGSYAVSTSYPYPGR
ncbi:hypothetical protein F4680DRAFT_468890 [Xylaria scruposa]|nr:hypothetical protein F4680DRAFT_468890 [Xylaria scruposa]